MMERVLADKTNFKGVLELLYKNVKSRLVEILAKMRKEGILDESVSVMKKILSGEIIDMIDEERDVVERLVKEEVLYYDPLSQVVRFQTRLDEKAAKELIGWNSGRGS